MNQEQGEIMSQSKLLPISAIFGDKANEDISLRNIVGLDQNNKYPNCTDIHYSGNKTGWKSQGYAGMGWGSSVKTDTQPIQIMDVFNLLTEAHKSGEIADLTYENLLKEGITIQNPTEANPAEESKEGFLSKIGYGTSWTFT